MKMKVFSTARNGMLVLLVSAAIAPNLFATSRSRPPYYVFSDLQEMEKLIPTPSTNGLISGRRLQTIETSWNHWEKCGITPVGVRRYPKKRGRWKFWVKMPWAEYVLPNGSFAKLQDCKESIPIELWFAATPEKNEPTLRLFGSFSSSIIQLHER